MRDHVENMPLKEPHYWEIKKYIGTASTINIKKLAKASQIVLFYTLGLYNMISVFWQLENSENTDPQEVMKKRPQNRVPGRVRNALSLLKSGKSNKFYDASLANDLECASTKHEIEDTRKQILKLKRLKNDLKWAEKRKIK